MSGFGIWMSELSHFDVRDSADKPQCRTDRNAIIIIIAYNSRNVMSYSISTLLIRSLRDVFGENDPARRRGHRRDLQRRLRVLRSYEGCIPRPSTRSIASQARSGHSP